MNGIANDLQDFEKEGILRGSLSAKVQTDFIIGCTKLDECVKVEVCPGFGIIDTFYAVDNLYSNQ